MTASFRSIRGHTFLDRFGSEPLLIDLGANVGKFAQAFRDAYPASRLVLVEGDPLLVRELCGRFGAVPGVQLFPGLIGPENQPETSFFLSEVPEGNSMLQRFSESWSRASSREISVEMITLERLFELVQPERVDLLKVDVEGAEWDVLSGLPPPLAERIDQITVEFHDFMDPSLRPRTEQCIARLEALGFRSRCRGADHGHGSPYFDCLLYRDV
jgi:FkbM family methyltransferase